jgi:Flp pilus assembly protein TadD
VREKAPLFALAAAVSGVTVLAQRHAGALNPLASAPLPYRVANALVSYAAYVGKTLWPTDLAVFYPPRVDLSVWVALVAAIALATVTVAVVRRANRAPYLLVGWLWYLGTLVPVIGLVRQGDQAMADRFTYLPSIGLFVMIAWTAATWTAPTARRAFAAAGITALAASLVLTSRQIGYWHDSVTLFRHALAVEPDNYVAHANLGSALARIGDGSGAEAEYREALRLDPRSPVASYDLGLLLAERGDHDDAIALYRQAVAFDPAYAKAWNNLGWTLAAKGDLTAAVDAYERALALDPALTAAHNNLAVALEGLGRGDEALAHYAAAVRLAPDEPRAHANYGAVLASRGRWDEAVASYREALRLAPGFAEVRRALDAALAARDAARDEPKRP